ncbi:N-acetylmuramoyl-L-alanine amidase [Marinicauda salina]|uniref:N-acetylmuramoyl-L-alanine amidase n=1 Tax=Marinicauda salina TaxID=2135793 RepID=A0A2U2BUQ9_9PROT|nr:N-acetylmuramoyl-L-alanine amidase [Marinicauda salina]PWE17727.1 N-acetylmuramoyl-L-alanine amidase [Marinicauda salina]
MTMTDRASPNFNDRAGPVSMLVLHYTGMETGDAAIERLCDPAAKVSAHYVVEEDGSVLRLVAEDKRAWHAGVARWRGIEDVNSASIGIEIVNGGHDFGLPDFPDAQIEAVIALSREILGRHEIAARDVVGHSDVAPERKLDPGERFPWARLAAAGVGLWPDTAGADEAAVSELAANLEALERIGYGVEDIAPEDLVAAFQRRYRPGRVDGVLDAETAGLIARVRALCA